MRKQVKYFLDIFFDTYRVDLSRIAAYQCSLAWTYFVLVEFLMMFNVLV